MKTYFVQAASGPIKIGKSRNVLCRLQQFVWHEPVAFLGFLDGDHEPRLHEEFAHLRIRNEWFRPADELLAFISESAKPGVPIERDERTPLESGPRPAPHNLRLEISASGLSQKAIAAGAGISESALSNILAGRRSPGLRTAETLLSFLRRNGAGQALTVENTFGGDGSAA